MGKLEFGGGVVTGIILTVGASYAGGNFLDREPTAATATSTTPPVSVEAGPTTTTLPNQLPGSNDTVPPPTLAGPETTPAPQFAVVYDLSHIACRGVMDGVIDGTADRIDLSNGTVTWSSLRAMERIAQGDNGYTRIDPPTRAETFAAEVMSKSGVVLEDVNITPPGTEFKFGIDCIDQFTNQPLNVAFPPES